MILSELNQLINTNDRFVCMTRPRRFGKSYVGDLLCAYYSRNEDSRNLFNNLKFSQDPSFEQYLNKFDVISFDLGGLYDDFNSEEENFITYLSKLVTTELQEQFPNVKFSNTSSIPTSIKDVHKQTGHKFVIFIDEYDALIRQKVEKPLFDSYLRFLNALFKEAATQKAIALAYITGILPIVREKTQSKLNVFKQYNFLNPVPFTEFMGFTEEETKELCQRFNMNFEECKFWYDGYKLDENISVFSPKSVCDAMTSHKFGDYWSQTSTFEVVSDAMISSNVDFKETILSLLKGESVKVDVRKYNNTMEFYTENDVLTFCILLGYLNYNEENETCNIPNSELRKQWQHVASEIESTKVVASLLKDSYDLLLATTSRDAEKVAEGLERAHDIVTSIKGYNDENSFQTAITYAYYYAQNTYTLVKELPTGVGSQHSVPGFADVAFIPKYSNPKYPAFIVELKVNGSTNTAMQQVQDRKYGSNLFHYTGNMILVAVNYDPSSTGKKHTCEIKDFTVQ